MLTLGADKQSLSWTGVANGAQAAQCVGMSVVMKILSDAKGMCDCSENIGRPDMWQKAPHISK